MKSWIYSMVFLVSVFGVSAGYGWAGYPASESIYVYGPVMDLLQVQAPASALRAFHEARRGGGELASVRFIGRDYPRLQLRWVKPLNPERRWERTGYTAVYGVERQVIVPWQPTRNVS